MLPQTVKRFVYQGSRANRRPNLTLFQLKELVLSVSDEKNGFCHVNLNRPNSESGMNEPNENFPSFDFGFTHSAVASFLDYIYTGQVDLTSEARAKEIHKG